MNALALLGIFVLVIAFNAFVLWVFLYALEKINRGPLKFGDEE